MATSQLGNGCKSKHEGDIKGLSDKGRGGGGEMGGWNNGRCEEAGLLFTCR